uniref:hypothetical protein n=2 Tax=Diaporthe sojae TaxID=165439 RepID=UPI00240F73C5|nr:hypothetical protein QAZ32_mgp48 [Diaporthe sojae]WET30391.1 hypothetical protein [Diaporthe sojae]
MTVEIHQTFEEIIMIEGGIVASGALNFSLLFKCKLKVDLCMSKGKQPRTKVKVPKLLLSEIKKVFIWVDKEMGLEAAIIWRPTGWFGKSSMWDKLSNSGEALKILILSHIWKYMSGWTNYSDIVTSQNMNESEMGNRGSKSNKGNTLFVKEQRVDGSWHSNVFKVYSNGFRKKLSSQNPFLENNKFTGYTFYKDRASLCLTSKFKFRDNISLFPNKGLRFLTTSSANTLSGWWVSGFTDAEGCFRISILKNKNYSGNPWLPSLYSGNSQENLGLNNKILPLSVRLYFQIGLHIKDEAILILIQSTLGVGKIYKTKSRPDSVELQVSSIKDMSAIIHFFDKYPLITQKWADYLLFKKAYELIINKQHLTVKGLNKLVALKALMNNGLSDQLKEAFPNLIPNEQKCEVVKDIPDPNWLAGFASGEGCFLVRVFNSTSHKLGYQVQLRFQITQQSRDKRLMEKIVNYLGCGFISERSDIVDYHVTKIMDITDKIIPFFEKYTLIGVKLENFYDFCKVAKLVKDKEHLSEEGLEKIKLLKSKMNTLRDIDIVNISHNELDI